MESLSPDILCLTLQHIINEKDVVEYFLQEFPLETEKCMPIALRHVLNESLTAWNLSPIGALTISDMLESLKLIWEDSPDLNKGAYAVSHNMPYIIPYIFCMHKSTVHEIMKLMEVAAQQKNVEMMRFLRKIFTQVLTDIYIVTTADVNAVLIAIEHEQIPQTQFGAFVVHEVSPANMELLEAFLSPTSGEEGRITPSRFGYTFWHGEPMRSRLDVYIETGL